MTREYSAEYQAVASRKHYEANKERVLARVKANRKLAKARNVAYVNKLKEAPCTDCSQEYPPYVMQFDHIGSDKKFNVSEGAERGYSLKNIQNEIDKCELVCANCHAERTYTRRQAVA